MKSKRIIGLGLLGVSTALLLSGCVDVGSLIPLPDAQRYQYVNAVKNDLDYASAGEVITERYDNSDGVSGQSFFRAEIEGQTTFAELTDRVKILSDDNCNALGKSQTRCNIWRVEVQITKKEGQDRIIILEITDSLNGRDYS